MKIYVGMQFEKIPSANAMRTERYVQLKWSQIDRTKHLKRHVWTTISANRHKKAYPELMALIISGEVVLKKVE